MRPVPVMMIRFQEGKREIFGRSLAVLRKQDGYKMVIWPDSGVLLIRDKDGNGEVLIHLTGCDVYPDEKLFELVEEPPTWSPPSSPAAEGIELQAEPEPPAAPAPAAAAAPAKQAPAPRGKDAPQVR